MNLSWTPSLPTCIPLICAQPAPVAHGVAKIQGYSYLDTVSYTCNPGYEIRVGVGTVVSVYINIMKTTFLFLFWFLQVNFEKTWLFVFMLYESLVEIKIKIESRLHCIDIYDTDCSLFIIHRHWTYMVVNTNICCAKETDKILEIRQ